MLFRANSNTKEITLRLRLDASDVCCDHISLRVMPIICEQPAIRKYCYTPCGEGELIEIKREPILTLVYDMFDYSEDGSIRFLLDDQFRELACGRYIAILEVCDCEVFKFQIDKRDNLGIAHIKVSGSANCCEGKYGC